MIKKGFTVLEVLITVSIFSILAIITVSAYMSSFKSEQRAKVENQVIQDARYILNTLSKEISTNLIDYEEYFNQCVIQGTCPNSADLSVNLNTDSTYGLNHGLYAWQFFFPGYQNFDENILDGFGSLCQGSDESTLLRFPDEDCETGPLPFSEDSNTGVHPATPSIDINEVNQRRNLASAFCSDDDYQLFEVNPGIGVRTDTSRTSCSGSTVSNVEFAELYLISPDESKKTIIGRELINDLNQDFAVSRVVLDKISEDNEDIDSTLPLSTYQCADGYLCTKTDNLPNRFDLYLKNNSGSIYQDFVPISPMRVNIKTLKFIVTPNENPALAYREDIKIYPKVTIYLEVEPSNTYKLPFFSNNFSLKLQTTVSTLIAN